MILIVATPVKKSDSSKSDVVSQHQDGSTLQQLFQQAAAQQQQQQQQQQSTTATKPKAPTRIEKIPVVDTAIHQSFKGLGELLGAIKERGK